MTALTPQPPNVGPSPSVSPPVRVARTDNVIGESPIWLAGEQQLVWADIERDRVFRFSVRDRGLSETGVDIGMTALVPTAQGDWIAASRTGLYRLDADFRHARFLIDPEQARPGIRLNDAVADRFGRLWTGSLNETDLEAPDGCLYRIDTDFGCTRVDAGFAVANGLSMSPDGRRFYAVDMFHREIRVYDHDPATGDLGKPAVFVRLAEHEGKPDGLCHDAHGGLWVCHWGGGCVSRYDSAGRLSHRIDLPVSRPTRCTFGGPDRRDLFICTARFELTPEALASEPGAGGLFRVRVPWTGLPEPRFSGILSV